MYVKGVKQEKKTYTTRILPLDLTKFCPLSRRFISVALLGLEEAILCECFHSRLWHVSIPTEHPRGLYLHCSFFADRQYFTIFVDNSHLMEIKVVNFNLENKVECKIDHLLVLSFINHELTAHKWRKWHNFLPMNTLR